MAVLVLYGSNHASALLANANDMYTATGATETSFAVTIGGGAGTFAELKSGGQASSASAIAIVPPSNGWCYKPGAGTFAIGSWAGSCNLAYNNPGTSNFILGLYQLSGGIYTLIGTSTVAITSSAKTDYSFSISVGITLSFAANDLLYVQMQCQDTTGIAGQITTLYEANSSTQGVANDMQITTPNFTASGGVTRHIMNDGYGGLFQ